MEPDAVLSSRCWLWVVWSEDEVSELDNGWNLHPAPQLTPGRCADCHDHVKGTVPTGGLFFWHFFWCIFFFWLVAAGGSWWLLWLLRLLWLLWLLWLLAPMTHLSSIDQSISEACSPGACCALDTHPSISISIYISIYLYLSNSIYTYLYLSMSIYVYIMFIL